MQIRTATIIGSSGMTGTYLFKLLLQDKNFETIRIIVRHNVPIIAANMEVILVDFNNMDSFKNAITGSDVVFCTIGTTQKKVQGDKTLYKKVDFDIPVNAARFCKETGCEKFVIVSSVGANSKSSNFYLRLKGEVEDAIKLSRLSSIHIMQPSMLMGHRREKRTGEAIGQAIIKPFTFLLAGRLKKYMPIHSKVLAQAMVNAAKMNIKGIFTYQYQEIVKLAETSIAV